MTEVTRTWAHVRVGSEEAALEGWMHTWDLAYTALKERDVPHMVRYANAGELTVYAAPDENAEVLRKTNQSADIIGIGSDGWAQLNWNVAKDETEDNRSGFVRLGDDAELGKPSRMEHYFVHPVEGELSFDEAEAKSRDYVLHHGRRRTQKRGRRRGCDPERAFWARRARSHCDIIRRRAKRALRFGCISRAQKRTRKALPWR